MDPTMQSPVRRTIPMPFSDGIEVTLSGPHFYPVKNWVGALSQGNTPQQAFEALSKHATPLQSTTSVDGGVIAIPHFGSVRQLVDPDHFTIVNTTEPGHPLYPGNVFRSVVQEGDNLYVVTHGYGTGVLPWANEHLAPAGWWESDHRIRHELNPYRPLGYPMDEMNPAAGIGDQTTNPARPTALPAARTRGLVSNEPSEPYDVQPPIFFPY